MGNKDFHIMGPSTDLSNILSESIQGNCTNISNAEKIGGHGGSYEFIKIISIVWTIGYYGYSESK